MLRENPIKNKKEEDDYNYKVKPDWEIFNNIKRKRLYSFLVSIIIIVWILQFSRIQFKHNWVWIPRFQINFSIISKL